VGILHPNLWPDLTCLFLLSFLFFVGFILYINLPAFLLLAFLGFGLPDQLALLGSTQHAGWRSVVFLEAPRSYRFADFHEVFVIHVTLLQVNQLGVVIELRSQNIRSGDSSSCLTTNMLFSNVL
jgi:hypothetical protein